LEWSRRQLFSVFSAVGRRVETSFDSQFLGKEFGPRTIVSLAEWREVIRGAGMGVSEGLQNSQNQYGSATSVAVGRALCGE